MCSEAGIMKFSSDFCTSLMFRHSSPSILSVLPLKPGHSKTTEDLIDAQFAFAELADQGPNLRQHVGRRHDLLCGDHVDWEVHVVRD